MELYAGLDLHSRNTCIGLMDEAFNRVFKKRVNSQCRRLYMKSCCVGGIIKTHQRLTSFIIRMAAN